MKGVVVLMVRSAKGRARSQTAYRMFHSSTRVHDYRDVWASIGMEAYSRVEIRPFGAEKETWLQTGVVK